MQSFQFRVECLLLFYILQMGGMIPLHLAAGLNSREGITMMKMLFTCLSDTDIRAADDGSYLPLNAVFLFVSSASVLYDKRTDRSCLDYTVAVASLCYHCVHSYRSLF